MSDTSTPEGREERRQQLLNERIAYHKRMSRSRGDYHFIQYQQLTGDGDFSPHDHGDPPEPREEE